MQTPKPPELICGILIGAIFYATVLHNDAESHLPEGSGPLSLPTYPSNGIGIATTTANSNAPTLAYGPIGTFTTQPLVTERPCEVVWSSHHGFVSEA